MNTPDRRRPARRKSVPLRLTADAGSITPSGKASDRLSDGSDGELERPNRRKRRASDFGRLPTKRTSQSPDLPETKGSSSTSTGVAFPDSSDDENVGGNDPLNSSISDASVVLPTPIRLGNFRSESDTVVLDTPLRSILNFNNPMTPIDPYRLDRRKSLKATNRRVSFAATAHVRLFEKDNDWSNSSSFSEKNPSFDASVVGASSSFTDNPADNIDSPESSFSDSDEPMSPCPTEGDDSLMDISINNESLILPDDLAYSPPKPAFKPTNPITNLFKLPTTKPSSLLRQVTGRLSLGSSLGGIARSPRSNSLGRRSLGESSESNMSLVLSDDTTNIGNTVPKPPPSGYINFCSSDNSESDEDMSLVTTTIHHPMDSSDDSDYSADDMIPEATNIYDATMEVTECVGGLQPAESPPSSPYNDQGDTWSPLVNNEPSMDMTMDVTECVGGIALRQTEEDYTDATVTMDLTTCVPPSIPMGPPVSTYLMNQMAPSLAGHPGANYPEYSSAQNFDHDNTVTTTISEAVDMTLDYTSMTPFEPTMTTTSINGMEMTECIGGIQPPDAVSPTEEPTRNGSVPQVQATPPARPNIQTSPVSAPSTAIIPENSPQITPRSRRRSLRRLSSMSDVTALRPLLVAPGSPEGVETSPHTSHLSQPSPPSVKSSPQPLYTPSPQSLNVSPAPERLSSPIQAELAPAQPEHEGFIDEDPPMDELPGPISFDEFLELTCISFIEGLDTSVVKRSPVTEDDSIQDRVSQLSCYAKAAASASPELELYQFLCSELDQNTQKGAQTIAKMASEMRINNPSCVLEYLLAPRPEKLELELYFKLLKTHARLHSQKMWYTWREMLLQPVLAAYDQGLAQLQADQEAVQRYSEQLQDLVPALGRYREQLRDYLVKTKERKETIARCDKEELDSLCTDIQEQSTILTNYRQDLTGLQEQQAVQTRRRDELRERIAACQAAIAQAQETAKTHAFLKAADLKARKQELTTLGSLYSLQIIEFNPTKSVRFHYRNTLTLTADLEQPHLDLELLPSLPCSTDEDQGVWAGILTAIKSHVNGFPTSRGLRDRLADTMALWQRVELLQRDIVRLRVQCPTSISYLADNQMVRVRVLFFHYPSRRRFYVTFWMRCPLQTYPPSNLEWEFENVYGDTCPIDLKQHIGKKEVNLDRVCQRINAFIRT
ncbi:Spc7 kinetochore protein-domain-containing protein [Dimargaris cristalligena]|uniref:Spc7 kinetochore protein-domain-containing protein n=1 Tax=Dimargaris cristalligena TaxID=215637 RepID=A0A4P9ZN14_9FUNG|nr:Spc7 kinetochore protein-domain-containing protein [Dimargaris cristalligena]|eukprot:RKP34697.1 Spc7 kinetochore protein-domain-containing protein [Dimargaris cristalligena]